MKTISLQVRDEVDAALATLSAEQGRNKADVVADVLSKYLEAERLKRILHDPLLARTYEQLAAEDAALAEEGIFDYHRILDEADRV
ncbi:MAG: hypothetical protein JJE04_09675 [Acidobacteriia bacterium]|nr:hypothetical protein [Terriglobia bacterium]